jgi:putative membrane protein
MIGILIAWAVITVAILIAAYALPGVQVRSFGSAIIAAAILGLINASIKPILVFLTLPITVITLGIFLLILNALLFQLMAALAPGFRVKDFWSALFGACIVSVVSWVANLVGM